METATAAMQRVVLTGTPSQSDEGTGIAAGTSILSGALPALSGVSDAAQNAATGAMARVSRFFHWVCYTVGYYLLRLLSTLNLLGAILAGVSLQIIAYYYRGLINAGPLICAALYAPGLAAMAVVREAMLLYGRSQSGYSPQRNRIVTLAYLAMTVSFVLVFAQPIVMRWTRMISSRSMWISVGGSALFYYSLLISEVLFASALSLDQARKEEARAKDDIGAAARNSVGYDTF